MPTIKAYLRSTAKKAAIRIRLSDGRDRIYYGKTLITISPEWWNPAKEEIKPRLILPGEYSRDEINARIRSAKELVLSHYALHADESLPSGWITSLLSGKKLNSHTPDILSFFDLFIEQRNVSAGRRRHLLVVRGMLSRFCLTRGSQYGLDDFPPIESFEAFLRDEHLYPKLYQSIYGGAVIKQRGHNTITCKLKILSSFFNWCVDKGHCTTSPFKKYHIAPEIYSEPVPLLIEEVQTLYELEGLPPAISVARDMFCLQCFTGCRVSDFMALRKDNLSGDILTYIPAKTAAEDPRRAYVPLSAKALDIIARFNFPGGYLVPRLNIYGQAGYNQRIKQLIKLAKIDRSVTVIDSKTRKPVMRLLSEVVSTHTARRTFINSNYMETQDPAMIAIMSGHSENSKAFARYRNIDVDLLRKQIKKVFD